MCWNPLKKWHCWEETSAALKCHTSLVVSITFTPSILVICSSSCIITHQLPSYTQKIRTRKVKYPNISTFKWNYRYDVIVQKILFWIYNNNSQPRRYPLSRMTCFKSVNSKFQIMHESWYPRISSSELYIFKNIIINYRIKQYKNQYGCQDRTFTTVIYLNASLLTTI